MNRMTVLAALAIALGSCGSPAPPEQQIVNDAAAALGGRDRLLAVKTLVLEGGGTNGNLGQDLTPEATGQTFTVTDYRRLISLTANAARTEQTRTPNFAYFQGQGAQKQNGGFDGDIGYNIAPNGVAARVPDQVTRDRRLDLYLHPLTLVRAALEPGATLTNGHDAGQERVVDIKTAGGLSFTLAIDAATHLPTRAVTMADNLNLGDVALETSFSDYQDVNGLKLPAHLTSKTDRWTTADLRLTKQTVDGDTGDLAAPPNATASMPIASTPPAVVDDQEVAPGVWLLAGQSHHSVLVEFADHLTLIEAPQHDTRTLAVIQKARELRPGKPLTQVITSHHHFDHTGGVRAAISEGLAVVTHKGNADFFQDIAKRAHSIAPDALAKKPAPLKVEPVDDTLELKDATRTLQLFHVIGSAHSSTMLMAYLPKERVLVEADVYTPGAAVAPYAANLLENITQRKLAVARVVPLHGVPAPFSELQKTAQAAAPR
jgi:glyoxylase-like metal-dependent hydrolase (beta-lactamase superfamily II)